MALLAEVHYLPERLYLKRSHGHNLTGSSHANYGKFREKWDFYFSGDPNVNAEVDAAFKYYYGAHAPIRHFKISAKASVEFLKTGKLHSLNWSFECFMNGVADLIMKKSLSRRWAQRKERSVAAVN
ncbi:hypothetical protein [Rhodopirellula sallentina]|nr:hypothetical protein [Rhodopirellula sallentina]